MHLNAELNILEKTHKKVSGFTQNFLIIVRASYFSPIVPHLKLFTLHRLRERTDLMSHLKHPTGFDRWLEIDLDAVCFNAAAIRNYIPSTTKFMAVVKANAYGLGAVAVAKALEARDLADMLAVTTIEEAIELRHAGISLPILVFTPVTQADVIAFRHYGLTATIDNAEGILALAEAGENIAPFHLKVNTGMNRFGCSADNVISLAKLAAHLPTVEMQGIYSSLVNNGNAHDVNNQISIFMRILNELRHDNLSYGLAHIANSAATLNLPASHLDMVRCGTSLYGQSSVSLPEGVKLADTFQCYCHAVDTRHIERGETIGPGGDSRAKRDMHISILPIGYADGFGVEVQGLSPDMGYKDGKDSITNKKHYFVTCQDQKFPVIGQIGMQLTAINTGENALPADAIFNIPLRGATTSNRLSQVYYLAGEIATIRSIENSGKFWPQNLLIEKTIPPPEDIIKDTAEDAIEDAIEAVTIAKPIAQIIEETTVNKTVTDVTTDEETE
jgi:alanine racemase